jgi:hypothetical protein
MLCRTDSILQNIPHIQYEYEEYSIQLNMWNIPHISLNVVNIMHNIVSPTKHYYGSK